MRQKSEDLDTRASDRIAALRPLTGNLFGYNMAVLINVAMLTTTSSLNAQTRTQFEQQPGTPV